MQLYIHALLRHMTCHAEIEIYNDTRYKEFYKQLYDFYLTLTIKQIFDSVKKLKETIEKELIEKNII